jgi:hypothetical protein
MVYLDASTEEALHKAALSVVRHRFVTNRQYYLCEPEKPIEPEMSRSQIALLLNTDVRYSMQCAWHNYDRDRNYYLSHIEFIAMVDACIKNNDGRAAVEILNIRNENEYEGFQLDEILETYPE